MPDPTPLPTPVPNGLVRPRRPDQTDLVGSMLQTDDFMIRRGAAINRVPRDVAMDALARRADADEIQGGAGDGLVTTSQVAEMVSDRLASQAEAEAGSNETALMTPLRTRQGIQTLRATNAQALAGTSHEALMTALRTKEARLDAGFAVVDDFRQAGDPDDTAAFQRAEMSAGGLFRYVKARPGKTYFLSDYTPLTNTYLELTGALIRRTTGARHAIKLTEYHNRLFGADIVGTYDYRVATTSGAATAGASTITVSALNGIIAGMRIVHASAWPEGGIEYNEVLSIAGNVLTLARPLRGNVANGTRILADFPMVYCAGAAFTAGALNNCWIRQNLFGLQLGDENIISGNVYTQLSQMWLEGNLGAGLVLTADMAGEVFDQTSIYGGRYRQLAYAGNGTTTTFAYPWEVTPIIHRWGPEASVRVFVNGVQLAAGTGYSADPVAGTVTLASAPANGAAVVVGNFEFGAYGIIGDGVSMNSASSLERFSNSLVIDCRVGVLLEDAELGLFNSFIVDGCSYSCFIANNTNNVDLFGCSFLFSPFPLRILGTSTHWNISGLTTSLWPDAEEHVPTANKREVTVGANCANINLDIASWMSKSGYTRSIAGAAWPTTKPVRLTDDAFAIGGPVSGRMILYGTTVNDFFQVTGNANQVTLGGVTEWKYLGATGSGNFQIAHFGTGALQWRTGGTAKFELLNDGTLRPVTDLAFDLGTAALRLRTIHAQRIRTHGVTVSALPAAGTAGAGTKGFVTDATATTFAAVVAGGGANGVPVYSDGTNWRIG